MAQGEKSCNIVNNADLKLHWCTCVAARLDAVLTDRKGPTPQPSPTPEPAIYIAAGVKRQQPDRGASAEQRSDTVSEALADAHRHKRQKRGRDR